MCSAHETAVRIEQLRKNFRISSHGHAGIITHLASLFHHRIVSTRIVLSIPSIHICEGERVGIIGHNGSGKSTLLRTIAGIYLQDGGTCVLAGRALYISGHAFTFFPRLTLRRNVELILRLFGIVGERLKEGVHDTIVFSGLSAYEESQIGQFSSGMLARLGFSCMRRVILETEPGILLLDEAFDVGTDEAFRERALHWLSGEAIRGHTVLCVSHDLAALSLHTSRIIVLDRGSLVFDGIPDAAISTYRALEERI